MEKIKTIIVDDESLSRESLKEALKYFPQVEMVRECANGFEAVTAVSEAKPDLVFLDIRMPKLDGFDVVEMLGEKAPLVVFVTAFDEYALKAFEKEAMDYILKPVTRQRLEITIKRMEEKIKSLAHGSFDNLVQYHQNSSAPLKRILVRTGNDVNILGVKNISHFQACDDYVKIFEQKKTYLKFARLTSLETLLDPENFCRVHRSYIINVDYLAKIEPYSKEKKIAVLKNGHKVPISKKGYTKLMSVFSIQE